jgi:hypothetical protein
LIDKNKIIYVFIFYVKKKSNLKMNSSEEDCNRTIRVDYPYLVEKCSSVTIIIDDNIKLAATIWMPKSCFLLLKNIY